MMSCFLFTNIISQIFCHELMKSTCVVPVVLLRGAFKDEEAASLLRFLSWLRQ